MFQYPPFSIAANFCRVLPRWACTRYVYESALHAELKGVLIAREGINSCSILSDMRRKRRRQPMLRSTYEKYVYVTSTHTEYYKPRNVFLHLLLFHIYDKIYNLRGVAEACSFNLIPIIHHGPAPRNKHTKAREFQGL